MTYTGDPTDWLNIPVPAAGDDSSVAEEALRSNIPDWVLEILTKALTDENGDGTLGDGFQVSDDGGLDIEVSAGQGFIGGLVIEAAAPTAKAGLTDDQINYIFLKKTATTSADQSFTVEISLSDSMADAILIAAVTCESGDITDVTNTPTGRVPYLRDNPNPQIISDIPGLKIVAPSGGAYTSPKTAIEAASAGDVVYICAGIYDIAATITVPNDGIQIIGASRKSTIINCTATSATNCIDVAAKDGVRIAGLTIQTAAGNNGYGITSNGADDLTIEDVYINSDNLNRPIYLTDGVRIRIAYCRIVHPSSTAYAAISILYCNDVRVLFNNLSVTNAAAQRGIWIVETQFLFIVGNRIYVPTPHTTTGTCRVINVTAGATSGQTFAGALISLNRLEMSSDHGDGIHLAASSSPYYLDETLIAENIILDAERGVRLNDSRVRETFVHGNKVATCATGVSDAGTNTNSQDQD